MQSIFRPVIGPLVGKWGGASAPIDYLPQVLAMFASGEKGVVYDPTDLNSMFIDTAGTTKANTLGALVQRINDKSPTAANATRSTPTTALPIVSARPTAYGSNLTTNPRFATATDWTLGTGWTYGTGVATAAAGTASDMTQVVPVTAGRLAAVTYTVKRTAGSVTVKLVGSTTVTGNARSAPGSYVDYMIVPAGTVTLTASKDAAFAGSVTNLVVREATALTGYGTLHTGSQNVNTGNIDLSGGNKATAVIACQVDGTASTKVPFEFGNYYTNTAGSFLAAYDNSPGGYLRGATGSAVVKAGGEGNTTGIPREHVSVFEFDLSQAVQANQIVISARGITPTQTALGADAGGGNLKNGNVCYGGSNNNGSAPMRGMNRRMIIINRLLTAQEKTIARNWVRAGTAYCAVIGDSTVASNTTGDGAPYFNYSISSLTPGMVCGAADVSLFGDTIAGQKTKWLALEAKDQLQAVFIQIGQNNVVGSTSAVTIAALQDLVNTVRGGISATCRIYICALTPSRAWLGSDPSYVKWQEINNAIAGNGATPITGVNRYINSYNAQLDDGNGYLQAIYDSNPDGVHENVEGRLIIAAAYRAALVADGLVY